jgi:hypothetical protein
MFCHSYTNMQLHYPGVQKKLVSFKQQWAQTLRDAPEFSIYPNNVLRHNAFDSETDL